MTRLHLIRLGQMNSHHDMFFPGKIISRGEILTCSPIHGKTSLNHQVLAATTLQQYTEANFDLSIV